MKPKSVAYALRYLGVAVLFAICGACSASFEDSNHRWVVLVMLPIPFALLSALLFMRTARAILVIPLIVGVWVAAYLSALNLGLKADYLFAVCVGGLIGGLGLALSVSICHRRLLTPPFLVAALIVGAVAALPFGLWHKAEDFSSYDVRLPRIRERCAFAIWQAVVGTCLYAVCSSGARKKSGAPTVPPPPPAE